MKGKQEQTSKSSPGVYYYKCWQSYVIAIHTDLRENTQKGLNQAQVFLEEGEIYSFNRHSVRTYCVPGIMRDARYIETKKAPSSLSLQSTTLLLKVWSMEQQCQTSSSLSLFFFCFYNFDHLRRTSFFIHTLNVTQIWMTMHNEIFGESIHLILLSFIMSQFPHTIFSFLFSKFLFCLFALPIYLFF